MEAKQQATLHGCAIDMPAGPSEVLVIADSNANPTFVASDFLSQAEHGPDSQSILLTTSEKLLDILPGVIDEMLDALPRRDMMLHSLDHSRLILMHDDDEMMEFSNQYAPEHLILNHRDADRLCGNVRNAGSVFIGPWSPESAGDYASGTNHTLPTSGYARAYSGVNIDSFMKKITFQKLTAEGIATLAPVVVAMAEAESLDAHALAAKCVLRPGTRYFNNITEPYMTLQQLVRPNILAMQPYTCARNEYSGEARAWLDANENSMISGLNRYPDPLQTEVKCRLAGIRGVDVANIFLGVGSDGVSILPTAHSAVRVSIMLWL